MNPNIKLSDAKCTHMELTTPVNFAADAGADTFPGQTFLMEAYTGAVVDRWWGKLAVVVDGIQAADEMPIFRDHRRDQIVGHSNKSWVDGSFFVQGKFSGVTDVAKEVKGLADEGFPWQASIGVDPLSILSLEAGAEAEVNGILLAGPAEIWLTSKVSETSFVPLGADDSTSVCTFTKFIEVAQGELSGSEHKPKKGDAMKITLALLESENPELLAEIRAAARAEGLTEGLTEGAATELARIQGVQGQAMLGHEALIETLMFDGKTTGPEAAVQVLAAERQIRDTALTHLKSGGVKPVAAAIPPETETLADPETDGAVFNKEKATAAFEKSAKLQQEFGSKTAYLAYVKAAKSGKVKVLGDK